jgi:hypothetical protein
VGGCGLFGSTTADGFGFLELYEWFLEEALYPL